MKKVVRNIPNEGMTLDVHPVSQRPSTLRKTKNFRLITRGSNSFVLSSMKGNEQAGAIPDNYVVIAMEEFNGVAYLILAEVIDGVETGRGEIGTYPSPNYTQGANGSMTFTYRPIMNYAGDTATYPDKNGPFRSIKFAFDLVNLIDLEIQPDYDGTVNMIYTDGKNPIRITNSGFTVLPGSKYQIINRNGETDSNRYTISNFDNTIQLLSKSTKLMKVDFNSCDEGGSLPAGTVQYFFALATSDGDETPIVEQSSFIPVFNGTKVSNINGGKNTGELTNKLIRMTLSNLDRSYANLVVYYVLAEGMVTQTRSAYRIDQLYPIAGDSIEFIHTGFENVIRIAITDLTANSTSIDTAGSLAQAGGRLLIADVKEAVYDSDKLRKFARYCTLGHKQIAMDLIGPEENMTRMFNEPINQSDIKAGTDAYNGGYANPKNVYGFTGAWGGEAYPYAVNFILKNGAETNLYPASGVDNVGALNLTTLEATDISVLDALDAGTGFSVDGKMINTKGIYRFPNRTAPAQLALFYKVGEEYRISVNGVTFKIPALNTDLGGGTTIKDLAIGMRFWRGDRRPDVLVQGTMIDSIVVPGIDYDHAETPEKLWDYNENSGGFLPSNSKLIPAWGHILETGNVYESNGSGGQRERSNVVQHAGIEGYWFNLRNRDPWNVFTDGYQSPFALLSNDIVVNPNAFSGLTDHNSQVKLLYNLSHKAIFRTPSVTQTALNGNWFSILTPSALSTKSTDNTFDAKSGFSPGGLDLVNNLRFSSQARFQARNGNSPESFYLFRNTYNAYMGVRLSGTIRASQPSGFTEAGGHIVGYLGQQKQYSFLGNVYSGTSQRSATAVQQVYQSIDNVIYYPISGKMYFDDTVDGADETNTLEGRLDANRKITLFGGDCYITHTLRKLLNNAEFNDSSVANKNEVVRTGYTIGLINEGNFNASIRSTEVADASEGTRSFAPAYASQNSPAGDTSGRGNLWRDVTKPESAGFNKGYNMNNGNIYGITIPAGIPFIQSRWRNRVWASSKHIANSFENGYRKFFERNYKDYSASNGGIIKLSSLNNKVYVVQETSIGAIAIDEKIQTGNTTSGAVFIQSGAVLSDIGYLSEEIGSKHKHSVRKTDNCLYGVDLDRGIIWATIQEGGVAKLSELTVRSYLDKQYTSRSKPAIKILDHDIVTVWNKSLDEVMFTFYTVGEGGYTDDRNFTIIFSETAKRITGFAGYVPHAYINVNDAMYSISMEDKSKIWKHDSDNVPYCNFYGVQQSALFTFVANPDEDKFKLFQNLFIVSNNVMPEAITYRVQGAKATQELSYEPNSILTNNCKYKQEAWQITIPKIDTIHHQDAEEKVHADYSGARSVMQEGSRVKGKFMIAEVSYNSEKVVEVKSVHTFYKEMQ